jgi:hypothetical protein
MFDNYEQHVSGVASISYRNGQVTQVWSLRINYVLNWGYMSMIVYLLTQGPRFNPQYFKEKKEE